MGKLLDAPGSGFVFTKLHVVLNFGLHTDMN